MTDQVTESTPPAPERHGQARQSLVLPVVLPIAIMLIIGLVLFGFSRVLLSVSAGAATAVALVVAVSIMVVAIIAASRSRLSNGSLFSMVGAVAGIAMLTGGVAIVAIGTGEEETGSESQQVSIAAPEGAAASGFAPTTLQVEADRPIALEFDNQDPGVQHNVEIFEEDPAEDPQSTPLFSGTIIAGPLSTTYEVSPLAAGAYFFRCQIHPSTMRGTLDSGEAGGGISVVAEALQFDTTELDLPAAQPVTISFENKDAAIPHNISIYTDDTASTPLFQGELFPGIATQTYDIEPLEVGEYYFRCDVHPTMNGTVVVSASDAGGGQGEGSSGGSSESPSG